LANGVQISETGIHAGRCNLQELRERLVSDGKASEMVTMLWSTKARLTLAVASASGEAEAGWEGVCEGKAVVSANAVY
jgi:hypothetical protein